MLILNAEQVRQAFPMPLAIETIKGALVAISSGDQNIPLRTQLRLPQHNGTTLIMPGHVKTKSTEALVVKVASVFNNNVAKDLPNVLGAVLVLDPATGQPQALLDGSALTAIRTAAASAAATDLLARPASTALALIGSGVLARTHLKAICAIRPITKVFVFSPNRGKCERFVDDSVPHFNDGEIEICLDANQAIGQADIVCAVTNSTTPVFDANAVKKGTHINAVGSYQPQVVEIPPGTVLASLIYVDHLQSALDEAGDLIQPIEQELIDRTHIVGEIGQLLNNEIVGRTEDSQITMFKSVGHAIEDCLAADVIVSTAAKSGIGQVIDW